MLSGDGGEVLLGLRDEMAGWYDGRGCDGHVKGKAGLLIRPDHGREAFRIDLPRKSDRTFPRREEMIEVHRTRLAEIVAGGCHVAQNRSILIIR